MASIPRLGAVAAGVAHPRLQAIRGNIPSPRNLPQGCAFHPRCDHAQPGLCDAALPMLEDTGGGHLVRCARWRDLLTVGEVAR